MNVYGEKEQTIATLAALSDELRIIGKEIAGFRAQAENSVVHEAVVTELDRQGKRQSHEQLETNSSTSADVDPLDNLRQLLARSATQTGLK